MSKILSVVLALCLMLALVPAVAETADVTGSWYTEMYGMPMELLLNEDGTASMAGSEGTWESTDTGVTVTMNGDTVTGTFADGVLTLGDEDETVEFTREAPAAVELAEPKTDAALEDFNGTYAIAYVNLLDNIVSAEKAAELGMPAMPDITIENGAVTLGEIADSENDLISLMTMFMAQNAELQDGKLVATASTEMQAAGLNITLLQDGMISVDLLGGDTVIATMIYAPVETDAE